MSPPRPLQRCICSHELSCVQLRGTARSDISCHASAARGHTPIVGREARKVGLVGSLATVERFGERLASVVASGDRSGRPGQQAVAVLADRHRAAEAVLIAAERRVGVDARG